MLPMGLKLTDFTKVNKLIYTTLPFNIDDEISRDNKIFGMVMEKRKTSIKNKSKNQHNKSKKSKKL
jgi:hypothetical protein